MVINLVIVVLQVLNSVGVRVSNWGVNNITFIQAVGVVLALLLIGFILDKGDKTV